MGQPEGAEEKSIGHAEGRRAGANTQSKGKHDDRRGQRLFAQLPQRQPDVGADAFERGPLPGFAAAFFDQGHVAELPPRLALRLGGAHAAGHQLGSLLFQMLRDFLRQIRIHLPSPKNLLEPGHDAS